MAAIALAPSQEELAPSPGERAEAAIFSLIRCFECRATASKVLIMSAAITVPGKAFPARSA